MRRLALLTIAALLLACCCTGCEKRIREARADVASA